MARNAIHDHAVNRSTMAEMRNIRRTDSEANGTHGWLVRVQRKDKSWSMMFSDGRFGGRDAALSEAIDFRDRLIGAVPDIERRVWHRSIVRINNTSGIPGVGCYRTESGREKWVAYWADEHGIRRSRSFSVRVYGRREAKRLAVAERRVQLERLRRQL